MQPEMDPKTLLLELEAANYIAGLCFFGMVFLFITSIVLFVLFLKTLRREKEGQITFAKELDVISKHNADNDQKVSQALTSAAEQELNFVKMSSRYQAMMMEWASIKDQDVKLLHSRLLEKSDDLHQAREEISLLKSADGIARVNRHLREEIDRMKEVIVNQEAKLKKAGLGDGVRGRFKSMEDQIIEDSIGGMGPGGNGFGLG